MTSGRNVGVKTYFSGPADAQKKVECSSLRKSTDRKEGSPKKCSTIWSAGYTGVHSRNARKLKAYSSCTC